MSDHGGCLNSTSQWLFVSDHVVVVACVQWWWFSLCPAWTVVSLSGNAGCLYVQCRQLSVCLAMMVVCMSSVDRCLYGNDSCLCPAWTVVCMALVVVSMSSLDSCLYVWQWWLYLCPAWTVVCMSGNGGCLYVQHGQLSLCLAMVVVCMSSVDSRLYVWSWWLSLCPAWTVVYVWQWWLSLCWWSAAPQSRITLGIAGPDIAGDAHPGNWINSVGYQSDTGHCFSSHHRSANTEGEKFGIGMQFHWWVMSSFFSSFLTHHLSFLFIFILGWAGGFACCDVCFSQTKQ